jgi:hypothetical protein
MVISQNRIGHSPIDAAFKNPGFIVYDSNRHAITKITSIRIALIKNLCAYFTVPSTFSYCIAVGR